MELKKAIEILKSHNEWRRGADMPMTDPKAIGEAIDTVVGLYETSAKEHTNPLFEESLSKVEPEVREEVRRRMDLIDLLTWQDIEKIDSILTDVFMDYVDCNDFQNEAYYTEVLKRFNEKED